MPALVGNMRQWRQLGGDKLRGNQRIHGNFYDFCVVSSMAVIDGKQRYVWYLVETELKVHDPLRDEVGQREPQRVQLLNQTTARAF